MRASLNILDRLHARLLEIVATGLPLLTSSIRDTDLIGLSYLRAEMVAAIHAYSRYVREQVEPQASASGDPARMALGREIAGGALALEQSYAAFTQRWAHRDGRLNWPEYRLSAIVFMKQVRDQVRAASRWEPAGADGPAMATG